jgi:outer membrane immunogenic protein
MKFPIFFLGAVFTAASPVAAQVPFAGPFAGIQAGWGRHDIGTIRTRIGDFDARRDRDSFVGGVFTGYDLQIAPWLVTGVEFGASFSEGGEVRQSARGQTYRIDVKRSLDATVRVGVPITSSTLVYARGGYSNARIGVRQTGPDSVRRDSVNLDGWLAGGGFERRLFSNVSSRLEYRYARFGDSSDYHRHDVLLGVAYRF